MAFKFPFTNYHELNLTWVLDQLKSLFEKSEENVTVIENYNGRLTAVETELPLVADTAQDAAQNAAAAASLAQTAKSTADTAQGNAIQAQGAAGQARQEAQAAQSAADAATQAAQQAQATAQNFDGRITEAQNNAASALEASRSFENRVQSAITTANNAAQTATNARGIAMRADQNAALALDEIGDLSELETVAKQNLVVALNEMGDEVVNLSRQLSDGNLNQHIISPFEVSNDLGGLRPNRATIELDSGGAKLIRNSTSSTKSYGLFTQLERYSNAAHKIFVKITNIDVTGATHFNTMRVFASANSASVNGFYLNFTGNSLSHIFTPESDFNQFTLLCNPGTTVENGEFFRVGSIQLIDLTEMFGAGYEPTIEDFESVYTLPVARTIPAYNENLNEEKVFYNEVKRLAYRDYDIIETIDEMTTVEKDKVLVIKNNSTYGDNGPCWFTKGNYTVGGYARKDGAKMYPVLNQGTLLSNNNVLPVLWPLVSSYVENDALVYGQNNTLFSDVTTNEIDCSSFISAVLNGIPYEMSRYVRASNNQTVRVASFNPSSATVLATASSFNLAQYFAEHKMLFSMPSEIKARSILQPGDLLFAWDGQSASNNNYLNIGHVGIILAVMPTSNRIVIAECGRFATEPADLATVGKISTLELSAANISTYFKAFARLPYCVSGDYNVISYNRVLRPIFVPNLYINEYGAVGSSVRNSVCDFIKVDPQTVLTYTGDISGPNGNYLVNVAEYDKNYAFISLNSFRLNPVTLSNNTEYIRIQFGNAGNYQVSINDISKFKAGV